MNELIESQITYCSEAEKILSGHKAPKTKRRSERLSQKNKSSKSSNEKFLKNSKEELAENTPIAEPTTVLNEEIQNKKPKGLKSKRFNTWHALDDDELEEFINNTTQIQSYANSLPLANNINGCVTPSRLLARNSKNKFHSNTSSNTKFMKTLNSLANETPFVLDLSRASSEHWCCSPEDGKNPTSPMQDITNGALRRTRKSKNSTKSVNRRLSKVSLNKRSTRSTKCVKAKETKKPYVPSSNKRTSANVALPVMPKKEIRPTYYLSHEANKSILPNVYPAHFTNQIPANVIFDEMYRSPKPSPPQQSPNAATEKSYFTGTKSSQSPRTSSALSSPRTPSLPESLRGIFESDDIRDILNIEKVTYRLGDTHLQTLSKVLNIDFDYLRNLIEKILKLNTGILKKFNTAIETVQLQSQNTVDNLKMLNCMSKYSQNLHSPPKTPKSTVNRSPIRSPSVLERTPTPSPRKSTRLLASQRLPFSQRVRK